MDTEDKSKLCRRFFFENIKRDLELDKNLKHRLFKVLRIKEGETFELTDGKGSVFTFIVRKNSFDLINEKIEEKNNFKITVAVSLFRLERFKIMVEKAQELGVNKIIPFISEYTKPFSCFDKLKTKFQVIADEAMSQCRTSYRLNVSDVQNISNLKFDDFDKVMLFHPGGKNLCFNEFRNFKNICLVFGPEGGFSKNDLSYLNFETYNLTKQLLRSETSVIYALSVLNASRFL